MSYRDVVLSALRFEKPAYVPWSFRPMQQCAERLKAATGLSDLDSVICPHIIDVRSKLRSFETLDGGLVRDRYGVTWDRSVDKDIGSPCDWPLKQHRDLVKYRFPDAGNPEEYEGLREQLAKYPGRFTRYSLAHCLYERAWSLRGTEALLMDMIEDPMFVDQLLDRILEHHMTLVHKALELGVDGIHFGDDYGMQTGLIMGGTLWRRFFKPRLAQLFAPVRAAGKCISLHSCGAIQEILPDLVEIGLNLFNPFQPEVMDVFAVKKQFHGKLAFHGGISIQRTMPFGSPAQVKEETARLLEAGAAGGYICAPSHDVPPDVPPENILAMMEVLKAQKGFSA